MGKPTEIKEKTHRVMSMTNVFIFTVNIESQKRFKICTKNEDKAKELFPGILEQEEPGMTSYEIIKIEGFPAEIKRPIKPS